MDSSPSTDPATASPSSATTTTTEPAATTPAFGVGEPSTVVPGLRVLRKTRSPLGTNPAASSAGAAGESGPGSSSTHSASEKPLTLDKRTIQEIVRELVQAAGELLHARLATLEEEQAAGAWLTTERDQRQIGDPLGSIAVRHGAPSGAGADMADLIVAGLGAVAYAARNITAAWAIRRARRKLAKTSPQPTNHETGEPA